VHLERNQSQTSITFGDADIHLWSLRTDVVETDLGRYLELLNEVERRTADRFKIAVARRTFLVTRGTLRKILGACLNCSPYEVQFSHEANGKPRLADGALDVRFNVAHSGERALIAITAACDVGVDIERLRAVDHLAQLADRYFHRSETAAILALPEIERSRAFLRCWTGKEAVLKALGCGVSGALDRFEVPVDAYSGTWVYVPMPGGDRMERCWLQPLREDEEYVAAVASVGEKRVVKYTPSDDRA
jgi:4'-phosphopantetheinyl transferase